MEKGGWLLLGAGLFEGPWSSAWEGDKGNFLILSCWHSRFKVTWFYFFTSTWNRPNLPTPADDNYSCRINLPFNLTVAPTSPPSSQGRLEHLLKVNLPKTPSLTKKAGLQSPQGHVSKKPYFKILCQLAHLQFSKNLMAWNWNYPTSNRQLIGWFVEFVDWLVPQATQEDIGGRPRCRCLGCSAGSVGSCVFGVSGGFPRAGGWWNVPFSQMLSLRTWNVFFPKFIWTQNRLEWNEVQVMI